MDAPEGHWIFAVSTSEETATVTLLRVGSMSPESPQAPHRGRGRGRGGPREALTLIVLDTRIEGFDARSWHRLLTLLVPGATSHPPQAWSEAGGARRRRRWCWCNSMSLATPLGAGRARRGGPLPLDAWRSPRRLDAFALHHGSRFAVAMRPNAMAALRGERVGNRVTLDDDTWTTAWVLLGALRELLDERALYIAPAPPSSVPLPPRRLAPRHLGIARCPRAPAQSSRSSTRGASTQASSRTARARA